MTRYHPLLVALHWLMALLIVVALAAGGLVLGNMAPDNPGKITGLAGHMVVGMTIGVLLILRLATRLRTAHPPVARTGTALLDRLGRWTHWGFYALLAAMVLSGLGTALSGDLFAIVYGGAAQTLPQDLATLAPRVAHGIIAALLTGLIALHGAATLYHHLILRDGLLRRMGFGTRRA